MILIGVVVVAADDDDADADDDVSRKEIEKEKNKLVFPAQVPFAFHAILKSGLPFCAVEHLVNMACVIHS